MKSTKNLRQGFTLVEIMIVVAIIGLLAAIAIPNFVRARESAQTNACINNLRQIDGAKQQWALETRQQGNASPTLNDIDDYLGRGTVQAAAMACPSGGTVGTDFASSYTIDIVTNPPSCKILGTTTHVLQ